MGSSRPKGSRVGALATAPSVKQEDLSPAWALLPLLETSSAQLGGRCLARPRPGYVHSHRLDEVRAGCQALRPADRVAIHL